jgi:hypothetical protein
VPSLRDAGPKLPTCCARKETQITRQRGEVATLARQLARYKTKSERALRVLDELNKAKAALIVTIESRDLHIHDDTLEHR